MIGGEKQLVSSSTKIIIHDISGAKASQYNSATLSGSGVQPQNIFAQNSHFFGSKINTVAWSHNN